MSQCKYCASYRESTIRLKEERFCKHLGKNVAPNWPVCDAFELANTFWCVRNSQWLDVAVCKNRRMNQWKEIKDWDACRKCSQWKEFTPQTRSRNEGEPKKRRSRV